jgi:penicillin-binding protein 1A
MPSPPSDEKLPRPSPPPRPASDVRVWVTNPARSGFGWWLLRYYLYLGAALLVGVAGVTVGAYRQFAADLPDLESIEQYEALAPGVTRIHAEGGAMLAELAREHRAYARYEDVPQPLVEAFLAAEDRRFFEHAGLDYRGLARAMVANYRSGTVSQGGSTITQQVAKGFLSHEQTLARKLREAILSVRMESRLPKERILEIYLNKIFLGHGAYGVAAAASRYFDKALHELTLAESALIAGMARAPTRYSPFSSLERAASRRSVVLQTMVDTGYITADERDAADAEPIELAQAPDVFRARAPYYAEAVRRQAIDLLGEDTVMQDGLLIETAVELRVQRMAETSVDGALRKIDQRQGWRGPEAHLRSEKARETLRERLIAHYGPDPLGDPSRWVLGIVSRVNKYNAWLEVGATEAVLPLRGAEWASPYNRNTGVNDVKTSDLRTVFEPGDVVWVRQPDNPRQGSDDDPVEVELGQLPRVESSLYTVDHQTGYVVAMQGGHDYDRSQFNRPIQGCRQPGSVFKAIYYAYALDTGDYAMDSMLEDRPYEPEPGEAWNPQNIHGTIEGKVLLRNAFIHSLNLPSIRLFQRLGAKNVVQWARRLGFTTEFIADKALSLGASCVRTDELTRAFGVFVRGGRWFEPIYVRRITNKRGEVVLDQRHPWDGAMDIAGRIDAVGRAAVEPPHQAVDARTAFLITKMMRDVVAHGIGRRAGRIGVEAGGKSGTASKHEYTTDTWFVGFTGRYVTAAWMGDDTYERSLGNEDASYTTATPLWATYMGQVVADVPQGDLTPNRPAGVRSRSVDFHMGAQLRSAVMWFR